MKLLSQTGNDKVHRHRHVVWKLGVESLVYRGKSHVCLMPGGRMREESNQEYTEKLRLKNQEK